MADYTLSAKITGDSSGFEKAFSTAQKTLDNFEAKTMAISSKISNVGKSITSVGDKLTKNITVPAGAAASALTGITAVEPLDVHALGAYIVEAVTTQGRQQSEALESGISNMKMTLNQREMGRFFVLKAEG